MSCAKAGSSATIYHGFLAIIVGTTMLHFLPGEAMFELLTPKLLSLGPCSEHYATVACGPGAPHLKTSSSAKMVRHEHSLRSIAEACFPTAACMPPSPRCPSVADTPCSDNASNTCIASLMRRFPLFLSPIRILNQNVFIALSHMFKAHI